jgi:hypothetical protein
VRDRATGPSFALVVARCRTHEQAFTLYPPGYAPYGRKPVATVAPDGGPLRAPAKQKKAERFRGTLFDAALDAAAGDAWTREHRGATDRWWHTQLRQIETARALLGLAPAADSGLRHEVAEALGIRTLLIEEQASMLRAEAVGYRERGAAISAVLSDLSPARFLADRLLEAGHLTGCWGAPYRWLPEVGALRRCPFRATGAPRTPTQRRPP